MVEDYAMRDIDQKLTRSLNDVFLHVDELSFYRYRKYGMQIR